ncbi:MAG: hydroxymethylbilane synthase [Pyramidobacter sp.]|jgi:hydroxymethylbilane synthase
MKTIRFGTRKSALALAQTRLVMEAVRQAHPEYALEIVPMTTTGDVTMKPFSEASDPRGIKGLFTQELEEALLSGAIDVAVHSLKDVPAQQDPRLPIIACFKREDPRDALVLPKGENGQNPLRLIGCSSSRRRLQARPLFIGADIQPVRGNVGTRLKKLDDGLFSALILAAAGLKRLGLHGRISRVFSPDEIVPAPGQGILACQGREGGEYAPWIASIADRTSWDCAAAERSFSKALGGGCAAPVGAFAEISGNELRLRGFFASEGQNFLRRAVIAGPRTEAKGLGEKLAKKILNEMR